MTQNQLAALHTLLAQLNSVRNIDFSDAPTHDGYVSVKGKYVGKPVLRVGLSAVNATFPDVIISERGGFGIESVASYPESKTGTCRYDANLPANALSACIYGDMHVAKSGYGRGASATPALQNAEKQIEELRAQLKAALASKVA